MLFLPTHGWAIFINFNITSFKNRLQTEKFVSLIQGMMPLTQIFLTNLTTYMEMITEEINGVQMVMGMEHMLLEPSQPKVTMDSESLE